MPVLVCTVPQFPLPTPVVKLSRVGFTPQQRLAIVVVVVLVVATVELVVVGGGGVDVVVVGGGGVDVVVVPGIVLAVVPVVLLVDATVMLLVVDTGDVDVVCVVLVVPRVLVVVGTPPGHVQSARQSSMPPPGDPDGHVGLPGGSHCSPGSMNELPHDEGGMLVLDEDEDEDDVVTVTVVVVSVLPVVDVVTGVIVVVVVPAPQFGPLQASQQLGTLPTQALPSGGA